MEKVFIAYGRNKELADKVAQELKKLGYTPIVGGEKHYMEHAQHPLDRKKGSYHFVGPTILDQIKEASKAIVLVQKANSDPKIRPNVLFELGILVERLDRNSLFIFLIDIEREDFFKAVSNLSGVWCIRVPEKIKDLQKRSDFIIKKFKENLTLETILPEKVFSNWEKWRRAFMLIRNGNLIISTETLEQVVLHGIQPSFYFGDIRFLKDFVLNSEEHLSQEIRSVTISACDYYIYTESPTAQIEYTKLDTLRKDLEVDLNLRGKPGWIRNWAEIIRNNFLGLIYRRISEHPTIRHLDKEREKCLRKALTAFENASKYLKDLLEVIGDVAKKDSLALWKGYIYRNMGRTYCDLINQKEGLKFLRDSQEFRNNTLRLFRNLRVSEIVIRQIYLETKIVDLDIIKCQEMNLNEKWRRLSEIIEALKDQRKLLIRPMILWNKVLVLAKDIASRDEKLKEMQKIFENMYGWIDHGKNNETSSREK